MGNVVATILDVTVDSSLSTAARTENVVVTSCDRPDSLDGVRWVDTGGSAFKDTDNDAGFDDDNDDADSNDDDLEDSKLVGFIVMEDKREAMIPLIDSGEVSEDDEGVEEEGRISSVGEIKAVSFTLIVVSMSSVSEKKPSGLFASVTAVSDTESTSA